MKKIDTNQMLKWSGREDLNLRPHAPHICFQNDVTSCNTNIFGIPLSTKLLNETSYQLGDYESFARKCRRFLENAS